MSTSFSHHLVHRSVVTNQTPALHLETEGIQNLQEKRPPPVLCLCLPPPAVSAASLALQGLGHSPSFRPPVGHGACHRRLGSCSLAIAERHSRPEQVHDVVEAELQCVLLAACGARTFYGLLCQQSLFLLELQNSLLDGVRDGKLVDNDVDRLGEPMHPVDCLLLNKL